jgi:hypothetical protein
VFALLTVFLLQLLKPAFHALYVVVHLWWTVVELLIRIIEIIHVLLMAMPGMTTKTQRCLSPGFLR